MIPTALAPSVDLAEPKVKKFAIKLQQEYEGELVDFYACVPCIHTVQDYDDHEWIEGTWIARISTGKHFSMGFLPYLKELSETISIDDIEVHPTQTGNLILVFCLSARVLRY